MCRQPDKRDIQTHKQRNLLSQAGGLREAVRAHDIGNGAALSLAGVGEELAHREALRARMRASLLTSFTCGTRRALVGGGICRRRRRLLLAKGTQKETGSPGHGRSRGRSSRRIAFTGAGAGKVCVGACRGSQGLARGDELIPFHAPVLINGHAFQRRRDWPRSFLHTRHCPVVIVYGRQLLEACHRQFDQLLRRLLPLGQARQEGSTRGRHDGRWRSRCGDVGGGEEKEDR